MFVIIGVFDSLLVLLLIGRILTSSYMKKSPYEQQNYTLIRV